MPPFNGQGVALYPTADGRSTCWSAACLMPKVKTFSREPLDKLVYGPQGKATLSKTGNSSWISSTARPVHRASFMCFPILNLPTVICSGNKRGLGSRAVLCRFAM